MKKYQGTGLRWGDSSIVNRMGIIIIIFGLFLLCFIWVDLYFKMQHERQVETTGVFKETANLAKAFEEHTLRTIKNADQTILFLKYNYEQKGKDLDIPQYIENSHLEMQPIVLLSIIDEKGELIASSQVPFVPANLKDREHFLVHKESQDGQLFISKPVFGRASDKWSIQITRRIDKPDGSFGGVVVASVDPFYFSRFYKQVDLGENSSIALIGLDGVIRVRQSQQEAKIGQVIDNELMNCLSSSENGQYTGVSPVDGIKRLYSYRALKEYPFVVLVGIDEEQVNKNLNQRFVGYYWTAGCATVAVGIFIIVLLLSVARRRRIERELKEARDSLEIKVKQRTQELYAVNEELTAMNEELHHTNLELFHENIERMKVEGNLHKAREHLLQKNSELTLALDTIEQKQSQLIQQEKLAGIGQLAAGVAHEINNPLGFVIGNIETLEEYFKAFTSIVTQYKELGCSGLVEQKTFKKKLEQITEYEREQDLAYILNDLPELFQDTHDGLERMNRIVKSMRIFAHTDKERSFAPYDLNGGLESTLSVAYNEIKYHAVVEKRLGNLPLIEAVGSEINQVLLNLIVNAAQAIKEKESPVAEKIIISTWQDGNYAYCAITDSGSGISPDNLKNIFNPFFTTKPVGQGTGLGLSISYDIIVNGHDGEIFVDSILGERSTFTIKLPIQHNLGKHT